jgi:hypothetical protein
VRFSIDGPVRDVIVCHCDACCDANGGPWAASAARREQLTIEDPAALAWQKAAVSEHGARRAMCTTCGAYVLWDAPARETVSFAADLLEDASDLEVAAHIWLQAPESPPASRPVRWHESPANG